MNRNGRQLVQGDGAHVAQVSQQLHAQQAMQAAAINAEVRANMGRVYAAAAAPYLLNVATDKSLHDGEQVAEILKSLAYLAVKSAPYLHQAIGMVQVDDAKHWSDFHPPDVEQQHEP